MIVSQEQKPDRTYPCCMCPAQSSDFKKDVCDGKTTKFLDKVTGPCGFIKTFVDERGWKFFVRNGIGENTFKAFYQKPGTRRQKGCSMVQWRDTFMQAQIDLNKLAKKKGWGEAQ